MPQLPLSFASHFSPCVSYATPTNTVGSHRPASATRPNLSRPMAKPLYTAQNTLFGRATAFNPRRGSTTQLNAYNPVIMPALSSTMKEGRIVSWIANEGDKIEIDDSLLVVESDKADMEVESFVEGYLAKIIVPEGKSAPVGSAVALFADTEEEVERIKDTAELDKVLADVVGAPASEQTPENQESKPESDASPHQQTATTAPTPEHQETTQTTTTTQPARDSQDSATLTTGSPTSSQSSPSDNESLTGRVQASGIAKRKADEWGIDLTKIKGTGHDGRIIAQDVLTARRLNSAPMTSPAPLPSSETPKSASEAPKIEAPITPETPSRSEPTSLPKSEPQRTPAHADDKTLKPLSAFQTAVSNNMVKSLEIPTFPVTKLVSTDALDNLYRELKPHKISKTVLLAKATALALKQHKLINSNYRQDASGQGHIAEPSSINIAIAMRTKKGDLITPVLKNADQANIYELNQRWSELMGKAMDYKLSPDDYSSGTFTISNLGAFGVDSFVSILPPNHGAILAVASSRSELVRTSDTDFSIQSRASCTITCDHRIIDGATAAEFMQTLDQQLDQNNIHDLLK